MEEEDSREWKGVSEDGFLKKILLLPFKLFLKVLGGTKVRLLLVLLLIVGSVAGTVYLAKTRPELLGLDQKQETTEENLKLVDEVKKIIALPEDETPTIATVTENEKLSGQKFFEKAENGDKVLVYTGARKAYLYRPSEKRIIEVGVVNIAETSPGQIAGDKDEITVATPIQTPTPAPTRVILTPTLPSNTPTTATNPTQTQ